MAKSILIAFSSPAGAENVEEYNSWYDQTHISELRAVMPSVTEVNRYVLAAPDAASDELPRYLAVYEIDDDDPSAAAAALGAALGAGQLTMSAAMDRTVNPPVLQFFRGV